MCDLCALEQAKEKSAARSPPRTHQKQPNNKRIPEKVDDGEPPRQAHERDDDVVKHGDALGGAGVAVDAAVGREPGDEVREGEQQVEVPHEEPGVLDHAAARLGQGLEHGAQRRLVRVCFVGFFVGFFVGCCFGGGL